MAFINKNIAKAKVGDYVKVVKKLPYKDKMDVDIGDIGVVNYVASTGKYSVHIDGKENPHDKDAKSRAYGKLYDFWIPFECCEVVDNEELTRQCLFENADALDDCKITVDTNSISFKYNKCLNPIKFSNSVSTTASTCTYTIKDTITDYFTEKKESEEKKMKEIKNQKVVDLYFKRKKEEIDKRYEETRAELIKNDRNQMFVAELKKQFDEYFETNKDDFVATEKWNVVIPITEESKLKDTENVNQYKKEIDQLNDVKEEILALLSGCDTYEQEMEILRSYNIVTVDNKLVETN